MNYFVIFSTPRSRLNLNKHTARIFWFDVIRILAIILVVFAHVHEDFGINYQAASKELLFDLKWKVALAYSISRMGVPLFFMLSGALLIKKHINSNNYNFRIKRISIFLCLGFIYTCFPNAINLYIQNHNIITSIHTAISHYNFITKADLGCQNQLWFFRALIPIYLALPFIALFIKYDKNRLIKKYIYISCCIDRKSVV